MDLWVLEEMIKGAVDRGGYGDDTHGSSVTWIFITFMINLSWLVLDLTHILWAIWFAQFSSVNFPSSPLFVPLKLQTKIMPNFPISSNEASAWQAKMRLQPPSQNSWRKHKPWWFKCSLKPQHLTHVKLGITKHASSCISEFFKSSQCRWWMSEMSRSMWTFDIWTKPLNHIKPLHSIISSISITCMSMPNNSIKRVHTHAVLFSEPVIVSWLELWAMT